MHRGRGEVFRHPHFDLLCIHTAPSFHLQSQRTLDVRSQTGGKDLDVLSAFHVSLGGLYFILTGNETPERPQNQIRLLMCLHLDILRICLHSILFAIDFQWEVRNITIRNC